LERDIIDVEGDAPSLSTVLPQLVTVSNDYPAQTVSALASSGVCVVPGILKQENPICPRD